jgi:hypothetical protein
MLLAAAAAALLGLLLLARHQAKTRSHAHAADKARTLREGLLTRRMIKGLPPAAPDAIRGVAMDWNVAGTIATLVAIDDGAVSLYLDPGGGIIGAGEHAHVREVATAFREEAARQRARFHRTESFDPPPPGAMTFYVLTVSETLTSGSMTEADIQQPGHPLSALGGAAQALITEVRQVRALPVV